MIRICFWSVLGLGLCAGVAWGEEAPEGAMVLDDVVVEKPTTGPLDLPGAAGSVDVLDATQVEHQNVRNTWQLYSQMPGVQLTGFGQGVWSGRPSFRGFNGEGEINAVKLLLDGIPSNSNDGDAAFMDMVFPLEIQSVEVVRGTQDPRWGLYNIAGNTQIRTKIGGNDSEARASFGSFNTRQLQAAQGFEKDGLSQNYFVGWQDSDGYRDHAEAEKRAVSGKWFLTAPDSGNRVGIIARHAKIDAQEPGYLTAAELRADPTSSAARNAGDGGRREMNQISGHGDFNLGDTVSLSAKSYVNTYADDRWVRFSAVESQQERVTDEKQVGALSSVTWRPGGLGLMDDLALEGGVSVEHQMNESQRFLTIDRARQSQSRNQRFDFDTTGGYVQAMIQPIRQLQIIPAWRTDWLDGHLDNRLTGQSYDINDYGAIQQPKLGLVFTPVESVSLYGNWGRTFQVGVGSAAYKVGQSDDLEPSLNNGWETGVRLRPATWIDGRVAVWEQVASNEARRRLNDPSNASENIGKTRRNGLDVELNLRPTQQIRLWAAYTWQDSEILKADASSPTSLGKEIDHVPHHLFSGGAEYLPHPDWSLSLLAHGQSDYYLERTNSTGKYGDAMVFDATAAYRLDSRFTVDFQLRNLTDSGNEYVWYNSTSGEVLHAPGDGMAAYVGVSVRM